MTVGNTVRSPLFSRFQGGDLVITDINLVPAAVWFVGNGVSASRNATNYGRTPEAPFASLAYAVTQISTDDTVYILPGHVETISGGDLGINTGAAGAALAGVRVIGLGGTVAGRKNTFQFGDAASALKLQQTGIILENLAFVGSSFAAVQACLRVQASDCLVRNCLFQLATSTNQAALGILTNSGADRLVVRDCYFYGTNNAGTTAAIRIVGGDGIHIVDCDFIGAYSAAVGAISNTGTLTTNLFVLGCCISNTTTNSTKAISVLDTSTGMICGCALQILLNTAPIAGTGISWAGGSFYANATGAGATLV